MKFPRSITPWIFIAFGVYGLLIARQLGNERATVGRTARPSALQALKSQYSQYYWQQYGQPLPHHKAYPYSVIPGGVDSPDELRSIARRDAEIAAHLKQQDFNLRKAKLMRLGKPRWVYVSFRKGNHIFWTTKRIGLAKSEFVITDGVHTIRTRCGNDVSDIPRQPTSPAEPQISELETPLPELPTLQPASITTLDPPDLLGPVFPPIAGPPVTTFLPPSNTIFPPPVFFLPGSSEPPSTVVPTPPVATPEPSSFALLCIGAAGIVVCGALRKRPWFRPTAR